MKCSVFLPAKSAEIHAFLNKQHFYKQQQVEIGKNQAKTKQHPEDIAELCCLKIISFLHPRYHPKIIRTYSKK